MVPTITYNSSSYDPIVFEAGHGGGYESVK